MRNFILCLLISFSGVAFAQVTIIKTDVKCKSANDGTLRVKYENAAEPIKSAIWNDGVNAQTRLEVAAGTYSVTVTDANDCTGTSSIVVNEPETVLKLKLELKTDEVTVPCGERQPVWLIANAQGGTGPYKINGSPGITRPWRVTSTTTMQIVLTDHVGCKVEREQRVYVLPRLCSRDPNEIVGPIGVDSVHWVSVHDTMDYNIKFENDPIFATAPAQRVMVTHAFDEDINPFSFRLGSFGFGDFSFEVPENVAFYQKRLDLRDEIGLFVDVVAGLNVTTQTAFWTFESIDPVTGLLPIDPLNGFLPVNDTITRGGEGFMNFSVRPKLPGTTGDTIHATAAIIFDINEPLITNTWTNLIDALPPTTELAPIEPVRLSKLIELQVSGVDDPGGSGLSYYELWVSANGSVFQKYEQTIPDSVSTYVFEGEYGTTYAFYVLGVDRTGNRETKSGAETFTEVLPRQELNLVLPLADEYCIGDTLWMVWETMSIDSVVVYMSLDSGMTYVPFGGPFGSLDTMTYFVLEDSLANGFIRVKYVALQDTFEVFSSVLPIKGLPVVEAGMDKSICINGYAHLVPSGANQYIWSPNEYINNPTLTIPTVTPPASKKYYVTGTDVFGCRNVDSLWVIVHPVYLDTVVHAMCNQDSVFVGGQYQTLPGFYTDELTSSVGCDSTVVTEVVLTGPCPFPSPQIYVDQDATGLNNGTSWADAFNKLSDAIAAVGLWADIWDIWVAEGTYYPHPSQRDSSFTLRDSIRIYGGFLGVELTRSERTADAALVQLSGDINIPDTLWDNSYHTLRLSDQCTGCVVDGVTITYGYADAATNSNDMGAGVLSEGQGHFYNVVFERNYATQMGAALYSSGVNSQLRIENCIFRLNTSNLGKDVVNVSGAFIEFRGTNQVQ